MKRHALGGANERGEEEERLAAGGDESEKYSGPLDERGEHEDRDID